jgi:hypothetical protein
MFPFESRDYSEWLALFKVCADNCDEIVCGFLRRPGIAGHMVADVVLHQFSHQTIDRSPGSGQALQHFRALFVVIQGSEHSFELADDFFCAVYQVYLFGGCVGHRGTSTLRGYSTQQAVIVQRSWNARHSKRENIL